MVLAIFNSFMIPLENAYRATFFYTWWFLTIDLLIDLIFLIDVVLMFFTTFINNRGREVRDSRLISDNRIGSFMFWMDVLSLLGANLFQLISPFFKYFGFVKIMRIKRLS